MISTLIMPQGGQDLETGIILKWLKKEGEMVTKGEVVCEVETEKAVLEVDAPQNGILLKIVAKEQEEVKILATIGYIGDQGDPVPDQDPSGKEETRQAAENAVSAQASVSQSPTLESERKKISPKARKLMKDNNIQLESLGSLDADGKITSEDMQQFIQGFSKENDVAIPQNADLQLLNSIQRASARRLSSSWSTVPHIFVTVSVDMTESVEFRKKNADDDLTFNDLIIYACVLAISKFPIINSSFVEDGKLHMWKDVNIGLAVNTPEGLIVPVIEDADKMSLQDLSKQTKVIINKIRAGKQSITKPAHFTVSNLGMYDVDQFTAIINPPEAAILAVSSIRRMPVVDANDNVVVRDMLNLTLSIDHRIGTGVTAAEYLNEVKKILENPESMVERK